MIIYEDNYFNLLLLVAVVVVGSIESFFLLLFLPIVTAIVASFVLRRRFGCNFFYSFTSSYFAITVKSKSKLKLELP